jgi:hypothetical protein
MCEPETEFGLDVPAGLVRIRAECRAGKAERITIHNEPAFCRPRDMDVTVNVPTLGEVRVDIACAPPTRPTNLLQRRCAAPMALVGRHRHAARAASAAMHACARACVRASRRRDALRDRRRGERWPRATRSVARARDLPAGRDDQSRHTRAASGDAPDARLPGPRHPRLSRAGDAPSSRARWPARPPRTQHGRHVQRRPRLGAARDMDGDARSLAVRYGHERGARPPTSPRAPTPDDLPPVARPLPAARPPPSSQSRVRSSVGRVCSPDMRVRSSVVRACISCSYDR